MSEDLIVNPENEASQRLRVDLKAPEYDEKFEQAEQFVKTSPVVVEEVTAEGLQSGAYESKGVVKNANGEYVLSTIVVNQSQDENGTVIRTPELENTYVLEPGNFIVTNPVWRAGEPRNHFVQKTAEKVAGLYEPAAEGDTLEGFSFGEGELSGTVMRPKGYSEGAIQPRPVIQNETGRKVEIEAPWGGTQDGNFDCYFAQDGSPDNRYILSQNDFAGYIPYAQYQEK